MSTIQTYNYNCSFKFTTTLKGQYTDGIVHTQEDVLATLEPEIANIAAQKFGEAFAKEPSHWFKINSTTTKLTRFIPHRGQEGVMYTTYDVSGTCVTNIDTDIANAQHELSPQNFWTIFLGVVAAIGLVLVGLTVIGAIVLVIVALVALAESMENTTTSAITTLGSNIGSLVIVLGLLAVSALGVYALFFTKTGQKTRSKG